MQATYNDKHIQMGLDIESIACSGDSMYITTSGKEVYKVTPQAFSIGVMGGRCHPWYPSALRRTLIKFFGWILAKLAGG